MQTTRRDFGKIALAALPLASIASAHDLKYKGVRLGVGTYSFRNLQLDEIVKIVSDAKAGGLELDSPLVEPPGAPNDPGRREALRQWRLTVPMDEMKAVKDRAKKSGIEIYAFSTPINESHTDEEIDRILQITKALGASVFNTSANLTAAKRIAPLAEKHKVMVGLHPNGPATNPDSVGSGESYLKALEISPNINANLDLYLYKNWGPDPIAFLKQIHTRVTSLHFHDRKFSVTPPAWVPFGEGDAPIKELLLLAKKEKYQFAFTIERIYTFPGFDQAVEIGKCLDYCRKVLD